MIKQILEESGVHLSPKLIRLGLPAFKVTDALHVAELLIFRTFQKKVAEGNADNLLGILNSKRNKGAMAFIQNFVHDRSLASFEKELQREYSIDLINLLQMNSSFANQLSQAIIPYLLDKIVTKFSQTDIDSEALSSLVSAKSET
jgi:hypothetical protein